MTEQLEIRGLHIDPARRMLDMKTMTNIINYLKLTNINTLHIHLTDDQGIAIESDVLNLFGHGGWTHHEQRKIYKMCQHAKISIIPEIDIPGHSVPLRSLLEKGIYEPTDKMGIITSGCIELSQIDRVLEFYEEVYQTFKPKYFHMGGDETRGTKTPYFTELIKRVCEWGTSHGIKIIAWEDVLAKIKAEDIPKNLIIQKWKHRSYPNIARNIEAMTANGEKRIIHSEGYYIDTCIDPFTAYRKKIEKSWLGCIACTWGELIGPENIMSMICPTIYMLGERWNGSDESPLSLALDSLDHEIDGEKITWNDMKTYKRRQWASFSLDKDKDKKEMHPRSSSSVTTLIKMTREEDSYPLLSKSLIKMALYLDPKIDSVEFNDSEKDEIKHMIEESFANTNDKDVGTIGHVFGIIELLFSKNESSNVKNATTYKSRLRKIRSVTEKEEQPLYKNGVRAVIREVLRDDF